MADERADQLLLSLCQGHDDMPGILNTFFSFLRRRTDFYNILQGNGVLPICVRLHRLTLSIAQSGSASRLGRPRTW